MPPKNTTTQLLIVFSLASLSICHIIRRDAIEETSVAMVTEELSSTQLASLDNYPNDLAHAQEDDAEYHEEQTNELGNQEGHDGTDEEHGVETSSTSPGETTRHITTSRDSTVAIETSTRHETPAPTTSMEQLQVDVLADTSAAQRESSTSAPNDDDYGVPCDEPPTQQLHINFKHSNQNVKFPALAILKKENFAESNQPGEESTVAPRGGYVNTTCPRELLDAPGGHDDISMRSLCPWTYVANVDPNRYPSKIMFAVCRCPECIRTGGDDFSTDDRCVPVHFRMKVLVKGNCVNGLYVYNTEYQNIPVACACVRPKS